MLNVPNEVLNLIKADGTMKNFRVHFPNGERADIISSDIYEENVSLSESVCSRPELKLGMCESPVIEFEAVGIENIKGCKIECSIEIMLPKDMFKETLTSNSDMVGKVVDGNIASVKWIRTHSGDTIVVGWSDDPEAYEEWNSEYVGSANEYTINFNRYLYYIGVQMNYASNMEIEIAYSASEWAAYKEDLEAYVYSIPLGTFYVDSCKKESNMLIRQVVAYGEAAYIDWSLTDYQKRMVSAPFGDDTFKISYSDFLFMITGIKPDNYTEDQYSSLLFTDYTDRLFDGENGYVIREYKCLDIVDDPIKFDENYTAEDIQSILDKLDEFYENGYIATNLGTYLEAQKIEAQPRVLPKHITKRGAYYYPSASETFYGNGKYIVTDEVINRKVIYMPKYSKTISSQAWSVGSDMGLFFTTKLTAYNNNDEIVDVLDLGNKITGYVRYMRSTTDTLTVPRPSTKQKLEFWNSDHTSSSKISCYVPDYSNVDFYKLINAYLELKGMFGRVNRQTGEFELFRLTDNQTQIPTTQDQEQSLWYEDDYALPYGAASVTYNDGTDDVYSIAYCTGYDENTDPSTYRIYDVSSNVIIKENTFTQAKIDTILADIVAGIDGVNYLPVELDMVGRPDIEAGDYLSIDTDDGTVSTIVMQRTLSGIQSIVDSITAQ